MKDTNRHLLKHALRLTLLGVIVWFAVLGIQIATYANQTSDQPADAAVVLGAAVYRGFPSPVFRERINQAIRLYESGQVQAVIFTGGIGRNDDISEGEAARLYALQMGVPDEDIYVETTSTNTYGNLENTIEILESQGFETILVVSDPLHMRRAMAYAADLGLDAAPSPTSSTRYVSFGPKMEFLMREIYFMAFFQIFPDKV